MKCDGRGYIMGDKTKSTIVKTMIYVFLILVAVIYIAPLLWAVSYTHLTLPTIQQV